MPIQELVDEVGISGGLVHSIMREDLCIWSVSEILAKATDSGAKAAAFRSFTRHAGMQRPPTSLSLVKSWVYG